MGYFKASKDLMMIIKAWTSILFRPRSLEWGSGVLQTSKDLMMIIKAWTSILLRPRSLEWGSGVLQSKQGSLDDHRSLDIIPVTAQIIRMG